MSYLRSVDTKFTHSLVVAGFVVLLVIVPSSCNFLVQSTASLYSLGRVYGYRVELSHLNIRAEHVITIDRGRVLVIGSLGETHGVAVLRVENPYADPILEDLYPLTGRSTSYATNGYPITRVAVGSDKGEILLLTVDGGRITRHLYTVLGSDFYVNRLFVARDNVGSYKVIALVSESGRRVYPCLDCYVYVFDEAGGGLVRVGPRVGNATIVCNGLEGVRPQDVSPLMVYGRDSYYYDASRTIVSFITDVINLYFSVKYFNESAQSYMPAPHVLVEVRLRYVGRQEEMVYGVNADEDGNVEVPIPRIEQAKLEVTLIIRDVYGNVVYNYTYLFDPTIFVEVPDKIPLPTVVLPTANVDTRPASALYGVPPFLEVKLGVLDLSLVPASCRKAGSADFTLKPYEVSLAYVKGAEDVVHLIAYMDSLRGFLNIAILVEKWGNMSRVAFVRDYVGVGVEVVSVGTFSDGSYFVAGLSDGRIRLYTREGYVYRLRSIYTMGSRLLNLVTIPRTLPYTYVAVSSNGIQVFRVEPAPTPIYRGLASLYLATPRYVHGDALGDLSTITLAEVEGLIVIRNTDLLVRNPRPTTLEQVLAVDVIVHLHSPGGEDLGGTIVELLYPGGTVKYVLSGSTIRLKNIIPEVVYTVNIYPSRPYISNASLTFVVREDRKLEILRSVNLTVTPRYQSYEIIVNLTYKEFDVRLKITDEFTGSRLRGLIDVYVDGALVISRVNKSEVTLRLLYGERTIEVVPARGYENVYIPSLVSLTVDRDVEVEVRLERVRHYVNLRFIDVYGQLLSPLDVTITGVVNYTINVYPDRNVISLVLPYGEYNVAVNPQDRSIYLPTNVVLFVSGSIEHTISINRVRYRLQINLLDQFGVIGRFNLYVNGTNVVSGLTSSYTIELPCGVYLIYVEPMFENEAFYERSKPVIVQLFSDLSINISLSRRVYRLKVLTMEGDRPIKNAIITIISYETGETILTLNTGEDGSIDIVIPSGFYKLVINHEQYIPEERNVAVTKDTTVIVSLNPTIQTLIWRYMPTVLVLIGIGVAVYVGLRIRAYISSRIEREEEII